MNLMRLLGPVTGTALAAALCAAPAMVQGNPEHLQADLRVVSLRA